MSDPRPKVSPELMANVIESAPDRVRRRLDRTPEAAAQWEWQLSEEVWAVSTGGERVTLPRRHIHSMTQLSCTCLLSPQCFHVLACLTVLEVAIVEDENDATPEVACDTEPETRAIEATDDREETIPLGERQKRAAAGMSESIRQMLRVGVANAGVVVQSDLLRAVHQCRAEGLHRAAAFGIRVVEGVRQFRSRSAQSDPAQLADDVADLLEMTQHLLGENAVSSFWIGTARRKQIPVRPRKLHGFLAEPIVTRSGYAGAIVYFLGEDDRIYSASDVRPGDAQRARDTYRGGIEIGPLVQPGRQLARGLYLGTNLTASTDGRLGRGKGVKLVDQGYSTWKADAIEHRFQRPLTDQMSGLYEKALLPADARPAGWDFLFLSGTVVGALGPELLFQLAGEEQLVRLGIQNEDESLFFRENLRMLSHAPGLKLRIVARAQPQQPAVVYPLGLSGIGSETEDGENEPSLDLPSSLQDRVCLGLDELQRKYLINARPSPVVLSEEGMAPVDDPLVPLRRRWIAMMLSGTTAVRRGRISTVRADISALNRRGFATAAALLDALTRAAAAEGSSSREVFLATAIYLRTCCNELARWRAGQAGSDDG